MNDYVCNIEYLTLIFGNIYTEGGLEKNNKY